MNFSTLYHSPGQQVTILLEVLNTALIHIDAEEIPSVTALYLPDDSSEEDYPQDMTKLATGIYYFKYTIPRGATAVGTYVPVISWIQPSESEDPGTARETIYQIIVTAPYGSYSVSSS